MCALDHPEPMVIAHIQEEIQANEKLKLELEANKRKFLEQKEKLNKASYSIQTKKAVQQQAQQDLEACQASLKQHRDPSSGQTFPWTTAMPLKRKSKAQVKRDSKRWIWKHN